jgi:Tfp pilus assembly protein PilV
MKTNPHPRSAFTLIETAVALGVIGFCLEAIVGLLPIGISSETASIQQTRTAGIASAIASDLQATPVNLASLSGTTSQVFRLIIPPPSTAAVNQTVFLSRDGNLSSPVAPGTIVTAGSTASMYRAYVTFNPPAAAASRTATTVRIFVTYPALADPTTAAPVNYAGYFETFTTLNRN